MFTIQPQNPSIQKYITDIEQVEQIILAYLEIKAKFYNASQEKKSEVNYKTLDISEELHNKLLALKASPKKNNSEISGLRDEISTKFKDEYVNKSIFLCQRD